MAVAGGQVHQTSLSQDVQGVAVGQGVADDVLPAQLLLHGHLTQLCHGDLAVEVIGVGQQDVVLHGLEVAGDDDVLAAGDGDEDIAQRSGLVHGHDPEAVHGGIQRLEGVDLGDDHVGAHAGSTHGNALAAPAVTSHDHGLAGHHQVGGVHDAVPGGLAGAVLVVVVVLGLGVVDRHHGAGQDAVLFPGLQSEDAGGGLLTAADEAVGVLLALAAQQVDEVAAVVDDDVGVALEGLHQVLLILLGRCAVDAEGLHTHGGQTGRHVILGGQGVGAGQVDLSAALGQDVAQVCGLGFQVDGDRHAHALEGLLFNKAGLDLGQGGHMVPDPVNLSAAGLGQVHIFDNAHSTFTSSLIDRHKKRLPKGTVLANSGAPLSVLAEPPCPNRQVGVGSWS